MSTNMKEGLEARVVRYGKEMMGDASGVVAGLLTTATVGPVGGAMVGTLVSNIIKDLASRMLSERELDRVATTTTLGLMRLNERLHRGDRLRNDEFFDKGESQSSDADVVFENVLLKAKNEWNEKKLPYEANIFANAGFSKHSPELIHGVIRIAEDLSYRQMLILSLVVRADEMGFDTRRLHWERFPDEKLEDEIFLRREVRIMLDSGFRLLLKEIGMTNNNSPLIFVSRLGEAAYQLMGLDQVPRQELTQLAEHFLIQYDGRNLST